MRFLLFFAIAVAVLVVGYGYLGWRLFEPLAPGSRQRRWLWRALAAMPLLVVGTFALQALFAVEAPLADGLSWAAYLALGFSSLLFTLVVARDLAWLVVRGVRRVASTKVSPASPERRRFMLSSLNAGKVGASSLMLGYGLSEARAVPEVVRVAVPIAGLPPALDGFRIAQLTDLHVGPTIKADYVRAVVERVNQLDADLVALTGDLVDGSVRYLERDVAPLAELESRHGSFVCTGNHEYYAGVHAWVTHFRSLGMRVLVNEHQLIHHAGARLLVAGVTDYGAGKLEPSHESDAEAALAGAPAVDLKLLLAHQPRSIVAGEAAGFDLQLSGHTHGGQFVPWTYAAHLAQPYVAGLHKHGRTWIYVSRGTGYWGPPLRLGAPAEITLLELRRG
jgi:predicted MPP superfamily phosphohydrolase